MQGISNEISYLIKTDAKLDSAISIQWGEFITMDTPPMDEEITIQGPPVEEAIGVRIILIIKSLMDF